MKSFRTIQFLLCSIISILFLATTANAQSRYKHLPRVKIQKQQTESTKIVNEDLPPGVITPTMVKQDFPVLMNEESIQPLNEEMNNFSSSTGTSTIQTEKAKMNITSTKPTMVEKIKYVHQNRAHKKLGKPEHTEKTNASIAIILLIVFYILAAIFTILCIIYALVIFNFTLFLIFLILAIVFGLAGGVISMLLKFGVVS